MNWLTLENRGEIWIGSRKRSITLWNKPGRTYYHLMEWRWAWLPYYAPHIPGYNRPNQSTLKARAPIQSPTAAGLEGWSSDFAAVLSLAFNWSSIAPPGRICCSPPIQNAIKNMCHMVWPFFTHADNRESVDVIEMLPLLFPKALNRAKFNIDQIVKLWFSPIKMRLPVLNVL